jgi:hypothetical protein
VLPYPHNRKRALGYFDRTAKTRRPPESGPSVALIEAVDQAKRNDARAPKAIFPLLFAFAETYKPA